LNAPSPLAPAFDFPALLTQAPANAIAPALREAMLRTPGDPFAGAPDAPAVLIDTLASLARLGADGEVTAAAILHALPAVQKPLRATIEREHPNIAALLEGQRAAAQVWPCTPNNAAPATAKACVACCSPSCATCAWC
jgi:GTP pyrophosphokinase